MNPMPTRAVEMGDRGLMEHRQGPEIHVVLEHPDGQLVLGVSDGRRLPVSTSLWGS